MNNSPEKIYITTDEIRKNKLKSVLLITVLVVFVLLVSALIGYLMNNLIEGIIIGAVVSAIVFPVQILTARFAILHMTRGQQLDLNNAQHRRLKSIVEGLAISAGMHRTPDVYIVPSATPNAFASGMNEQTAFIGVTQGLLDMMDDQELSGVIGHEISHIVHRDIMVSTLAVALVTIILILASIASQMAFFSGNRRGSSNNNSNGNAELFGIVVILLAFLLRPLAMFIGNIIEMSISRKREFAADAYSVRLNGYALGLARALEKLSNGGEYNKEQVDSLGGNQMKCMYINYPSANVSSLFSTHPPIEERIKILKNMY